MAIYDVKTLVAQLIAVGEQHWSPPSSSALRRRRARQVV
jgi:hypothetical protein